MRKKHKISADVLVPSRPQVFGRIINVEFSDANGKIRWVEMNKPDERLVLYGRKNKHLASVLWHRDNSITWPGSTGWRPVGYVRTITYFGAGGAVFKHFFRRPPVLLVHTSGALILISISAKNGQITS